MATQEEEQEALFQNTDILTDEGLVSIAGLLLFGIQPQKRLHNASISFAHYGGLFPDSELIDLQVIEGTLDYQVDTALAVIRHNLLQPSTIEKGQRVPLAVTYPEKVYRELLVNACVHLEKLKRGVSYAVNPVILKFMENLRYIDKLGRGLPCALTVSVYSLLLG